MREKVCECVRVLTSFAFHGTTTRLIISLVYKFVHIFFYSHIY